MRSPKTIPLLALTTLLGCQSAASPPAPSSPTPAAKSRHLPELARNVLLPSMEGHAENMNLLFWSVLFLDRQGTEQLADVLASGPRLARPNANTSDSVNAQLPEAFYDLQDELAQKAGKLRTLAAAPESDAVAIANAYGELTATCVKCHQTFFSEQK